MGKRYSQAMGFSMQKGTVYWGRSAYPEYMAIEDNHLKDTLTN